MFGFKKRLEQTAGTLNIAGEIYSLSLQLNAGKLTGFTVRGKDSEKLKAVKSSLSRFLNKSLKDMDIKTFIICDVCCLLNEDKEDLMLEL